MTENERIALALGDRAGQLRKQARLRKNGGLVNAEFRNWLRTEAKRCELLKGQIQQGIVCTRFTPKAPVVYHACGAVCESKSRPCRSAVFDDQGMVSHDFRSPEASCGHEPEHSPCDLHRSQGALRLRARWGLGDVGWEDSRCQEGRTPRYHW